jgi:hypothetical protein
VITSRIASDQCRVSDSEGHSYQRGSPVVFAPRQSHHLVGRHARFGAPAQARKPALSRPSQRLQKNASICRQLKLTDDAGLRPRWSRNRFGIVTCPVVVTFATLLPRNTAHGRSNA